MLLCGMICVTVLLALALYNFVSSPRVYILNRSEDDPNNITVQEILDGSIILNAQE